MDSAKKNTNRARTDPTHCDDHEYLPSRITDSDITDFAAAVSVCEYFIAEQKPGDGLALLVDFLRAEPQYAKRMRQFGQERLAAGEPELAALLFRAVLQQKKPQTRSNRDRPPYADDEILSEVDSPSHSSEFDFIDQYGSEKRLARNYDAGQIPQHVKPRIPAIPKIQNSPKQDEIAHQPVPTDADDRVDTRPTQADFLESLEDVEVDVEVGLFVYSPPEQLDLSIFDEVPDDPDDSDEFEWLDSDEADLTDHEASPSDVLSEDQDWQQYLEDAFEFEEAPTRDDLDEVATTARVTREHRCTQQAIEVAQRFDWDDSGVLLLKEIFMQYSWNAAKAALIRQLERDVSQSELRLAHQLRILWSTTPEFSLSFGKYPHFVLSWPLAVEIIRSYRGEPDLAEIEHFLWNARDQWYSTNHLRNSFPAFRDFVKARINVFEADRICSNAMDWTDGMPIDAFDLDPVSEDLNNTPKINDLRTYDLLPTKSDDIADRIGITEWHEQVEAWATPPEYEIRLNSRGQDKND
ncbi:MAG TPA: hypothetical protein PKH39_06175 [Woeseiaceae bacterium]|nr:hypothetical protein [Woeseiaceae bacterium]